MVVVSGNGASERIMDPLQRTPNDDAKRSIVVVDGEQQNGNVEYKRQVHQANASRLRSLTSQMSYRLDQGDGTCIYRIGVEDDGCHSLLQYDAVAESARILECIARTLNAVVTERFIIQNEIDSDGLVVDEQNVIRVCESPVFAKADLTNQSDLRLLRKTGAYTRAEITIQRVETHLLDQTPKTIAELIEETEASMNGSTCIKTEPPESVPLKNCGVDSVGETLASRNIRIAVVGNVDAGKSTLIGALTTSSLDDGRGRCRTSIMKHRHEIESGRTSTATTHLMGFNAKGEPIAGRDSVRANKRKGEDEVVREAFRIITLMDLAGHEKYLKTTIHGVSSGFADYALILVNSRQPPTHMTQQHLNLCCSYGIPVIVIFTKTDGCPEHAFENCKKEINKMLKSPEVGKRPFAVRTETDVTTVMDKLHTLAPMIETSCVTGDGIDLLQKMLFTLPKRRRHEKKANRKFEFLVEDIFNVPGVGGVVSGFVNAGELTVGVNCNVYVGPIDDGTFMKTVAKSAQIARINTSHITAGQSACIAFSLNKDMRKKLRRGMVVVQENPTCTREFDAEICVLKGEATTIRRSYQAYVHILNVRQSAFARHIEIMNSTSAGLPPSLLNANVDEDNGIVLRPGSRAKVRFEFAQRPEYIRPGMRMLFRDGRVRGVGIITSIPKATEVSS